MSAECILILSIFPNGKLYFAETGFQGRTARWGIAWSFSVDKSTAYVPLARGQAPQGSLPPEPPIGVPEAPPDVAAAGVAHRRQSSRATAAQQQQAAGLERQLKLRQERQRQEQLQQQLQSQLQQTAPQQLGAQPSTKSATKHASFQLQANPQRAQALFQRLKPLLEESGARNVQVDPAVWGVSAMLPCTTPAAAAETPEDEQKLPGREVKLRISMMQLQKGVYSVSASVPQNSSGSDIARMQSAMRNLQARIM